MFVCLKIGFFLFSRIEEYIQELEKLTKQLRPNLSKVSNKKLSTDWNTHKENLQTIITVCLDGDPEENSRQVLNLVREKENRQLDEKLATQLIALHLIDTSLEVPTLKSTGLQPKSKTR